MCDQFCLTLAIHLGVSKQEPFPSQSVSIQCPVALVKSRTRKRVGLFMPNLFCIKVTTRCLGPSSFALQCFGRNLNVPMSQEALMQCKQTMLKCLGSNRCRWLMLLDASRGTCPATSEGLDRDSMVYAATRSMKPGKNKLPLKGSASSVGVVDKTFKGTDFFAQELRMCQNMGTHHYNCMVFLLVSLPINLKRVPFERHPQKELSHGFVKVNPQNELQFSFWFSFFNLNQKRNTGPHRNGTNIGSLQRADLRYVEKGVAASSLGNIRTVCRDILTEWRRASDGRRKRGVFCWFRKAGLGGVAAINGIS